MDSGLIFPIIVALWAAYLVPQWIRRREHLSAARSVDRFSAAMRVLARRDGPALPEHRPVNRSYVLMPPRQDLQDLVVKRTRRVDPAPTRVLAPARVQAPAVTGAADAGQAPYGAGHGVEVTGGADSLPVTLPRRSPVPGLVLLASLAALPVLTVLALLGMVGAGWLLVPIVAGAVAVVLLRRAAVRRAAARRAARRRRPVKPARPQREVSSGSGGVIPDFVERPFDAPEQPAAVVDDSWTPVPVPPPTYTLKPPAPRRGVSVEQPLADPRPVTVPEAAVATAAVADGQPTEQPAEQPVAEQVAAAATVVEEPARPVARRAVPDLNLVLERRRASGE